MLNHARTLLANLSPLNLFGAGSYLAEEWIDPAFVPLALPGYVVRLRAVLFGADPDRHMVNYRVRQLLTAVHASPWEEWLLALDPRVTYATGEDSSLLEESLFIPRSSRLSGTQDLAPSFFGSPTPPDPSGKAYLAYEVSIPSAGTARVAGDGITIPDTTFTMQGGLSTPVPLGRSGYSLRLPTPSLDYSWLVEVLRRPQWDLGQLAATADRLGEATLAGLFGVAAVEPYASCRNAWYGQKELPLRLGALAVALAHRCEEVRRGG